jgi:MoxR-like ATPase
MEQYRDELELAKSLGGKYAQLRQEIAKVIVGQEDTVQQLLMAVFCQAHCLLVGVPGLAKTLLVQTIANVLDLKFNRIQFTPDLMPSDILGFETLDQERNFKFTQGAIFANIVLADEINRTPPKTQSALLEAMQEHAVTISGKRYKLDLPFFVLATQNPIEQEGTYPLPEAQLDRFMFNVFLDYPSLEAEKLIVKNTTADYKVTVNKILTIEEILAIQKLVRSPAIEVPDNVIDYAVRLVHKTRPNTENASKEANQYLEWGAGPRASQYLILGAKCHKLLTTKTGDYIPNIEDVKAVAKPILRHRIVRNFKAEAEGMTVDAIIDKIL